MFFDGRIQEFTINENGKETSYYGIRFIERDLINAEMIQHANQHWARKNLTFEVHNIEEFHVSLEFDFVLSFWCLHWTNIELSFPNIYNALKTGGRAYAVFSSFSDNSILQTCYELIKKNRYSDLMNKHISSTKSYRTFFYRAFNALNQLPFKQVKLNLKTHRVYLPSIDYFKNLLITMPFIKTFPPDTVNDLIEEMLDAFQTLCQRKYGNTLYYETRPIFLEALK